ncbi:MAG: alkaline phosphatase family protein [Acidobacteria bacterium]|nr:alkaline phosphatase family protein [Acidobacteriota bacterium]
MAFEKIVGGKQVSHTINGGEEKPGSRFYNQFELSPFANDYLVDFAKTAIVNEKLGTDDDTDLLTISFSSNDLIGHYYGPFSQEVQDVTLRTDRAIAELFSYLDKKIGLDKVVVALTADHGVAPVPEQVRELGYGGRLEIKPVTDAIESALDKRFEDDKWILSAVNGNIYFDESVIERRKASMHEVEQIACQVIMKQPGMAECLTRTQLMGNNIPQTMLARSVANGFHSSRNGNIILVTLPFYFFGEGVTTTHGSPYSYDTHVPVLFYGWESGRNFLRRLQPG